MSEDSSAPGTLYVCATPIGNLGDVSSRLGETLRKVGFVYAEDTRRAGKLLSAVGASTPVRSMFVGNEKARAREALEHLENGLDVALISDAGTTSVSDPGSWLVARAHGSGFPVRVIPGPSAVTAALALSGFPADRFTFEGFLPRKGGEREEALRRIAEDHRTVVLFASPKRLADDLRDLHRLVGPDRPIAVTRELTKLYEEAWVGPLGEALAVWSEEPKGELTLVLGPQPPSELPLEVAVERARRLVSEGVSVSEAARQVATELGVSRRAIYQSLLDDADV